MASSPSASRSSGLHRLRSQGGDTRRALALDGKRLTNILLTAPPEAVRLVLDEAAMYVRLSPCDAESTSQSVYYPVVGDPEADPTKLVVAITPYDPQPPLADWPQTCVQVVADGMSVWKYRSNIVRARLVPRSTATSA